MSVTFRRKANRLGKQAYVGHFAYSLTLACHERTPWFRNAGLVAKCLEFLRWAADKHAVLVYAYCFMPDHLHLLVQGGNNTRVGDFVHDFKQKGGYLVSQVTGRVLWQRSYYDHVLRTDEDLLASARYLAANPVRAGLAAQPGDYPHLGSFVWERGALVEP
jgi:putative transposase